MRNSQTLSIVNISFKFLNFLTIFSRSGLKKRLLKATTDKLRYMYSNIFICEWYRDAEPQNTVHQSVLDRYRDFSLKIRQTPEISSLLADSLSQSARASPVGPERLDNEFDSPWRRNGRAGGDTSAVSRLGYRLWVRRRRTPFSFRSASCHVQRSLHIAFGGLTEIRKNMRINRSVSSRGAFDSAKNHKR